jgi:hypothetical protein
MTVIEGPVDDFVSPGDFVLSTGLDQGPEQLCDLVADVAGSEAAALAVGGDGPIERVPDARALADRHGMPLLELPWAVRFADVLRALTDRLLAARYAATLDAGDQLPAHFADARLTRKGVEAIAAATEALVDRPAHPRRLPRRRRPRPGRPTAGWATPRWPHSPRPPTPCSPPRSPAFAGPATTTRCAGSAGAPRRRCPPASALPPWRRARRSGTSSRSTRRVPVSR